jgi:hypothetical protein
MRNGISNRFENQLNDIKGKITQVNRKRKADQVCLFYFFVVYSFVRASADKVFSTSLIAI